MTICWGDSSQAARTYRGSAGYLLPGEEEEEEESSRQSSVATNPSDRQTSSGRYVRSVTPTSHSSVKLTWRKFPKKSRSTSASPLVCSSCSSAWSACRSTASKIFSSSERLSSCPAWAPWLPRRSWRPPVSAVISCHSASSTLSSTPRRLRISSSTARRSRSGWWSAGGRGRGRRYLRPRRSRHSITARWSSSVGWVLKSWPGSTRTWRSSGSPGPAVRQTGTLKLRDQLRDLQPAATPALLCYKDTVKGTQSPY